MDDRDQSVRKGPGSMIVTFTPKGAPSWGEYLREALDTPLGQLVGAEAGGAEAPTDGGELNDVAAALGVQHWQRGAGYVDDAPQVRLDLCAEVLWIGVLDGVDVRVAGRVHHYIQAAEPPGHRLDGGLGRAGIGNVEGDSTEAAAVGFGEVLQ